MRLLIVVVFSICLVDATSSRLLPLRSRFASNRNSSWIRTLLHFGSSSFWTCRIEVDAQRFDVFLNETVSPLLSDFTFSVVTGQASYGSLGIAREKVFVVESVFPRNLTVVVPLHFRGAQNGVKCPSRCDSSCQTCHTAGVCPKCPKRLEGNSVIGVEQAIEWIRQSYNCLYLQESVFRENMEVNVSY